MRPDPQTLDQLPTPSLVVERGVFDANVAAMAAAWPGPSLRPHVKAFKSTAIARILAAAGHEGFCAATVRELEGLAAAGLGRDLLLANEVLDASRLGRLVDAGHRVTVAVDSDATVAAAGGVTEVLVRRERRADALRLRPGRRRAPRRRGPGRGAGGPGRDGL